MDAPELLPHATPQAEYDSHVDDHQRFAGASRYAATVVGNLLDRWLEIRSVLDLGCGTGAWLRGFAADGRRDVVGVEQEQIDPQFLEIDPDRILHADLNLYLDLHRRFDLVLCLEVAEHLAPEAAATIVATCVRHADLVLFSAALPGQQGRRHQNEQLPEYWRDLFHTHDLIALDIIRPLIWNDRNIPVWYRQNIMLFARESLPVVAQLRTEAQRLAAAIPLNRAHPDLLMWLSHAATRAESDTAGARGELAQARTDLAQSRTRLAQSRAELSQTSMQLDAAQQDLERVSQELTQATGELTRLRREYDSVVGSTLWQATGPLRRVGRAVPAPLRRTVAWMLRAPVTAARKLRGLRRGRNPAATEAATAADIRPSAWRIVVISGEPDTPGHDYRVVRFAEAAKAIGASVLCLTRARMAANHRELAEADFVVIWRAGNEPDVAAAIAAVRKGKAKLLVDIDDLMFVPEMASELVIDGIRSQQHDSREVGLLFLRVREVLAQADACVCTTDELAKHARRMGKLTFVLPNGFDANVHSAARLAVRHRGVSDHDGLFRIGYPAGTRTHQRDFGVAVEAVARILHRYPASRLVLFRDPVIGWPMLDIDEFPALEQVAAQIEWRDFVPLPDLPAELARLDATIVPLETGNPFCEAKSELKFFEAALAGVCTVASPTEPLRDAIRDGETGLLADTTESWFEAIRHLIEDPELRRRIAHAAYLDVLWRYGPHRRADLVLSLLTQLEGGEDAARAFELEFRRRNASRTTPPSIPRSEVVFAADALGTAEVTVVIPLFNYARYVTDALESVKEQTLQPIDLVVVDDCSTDNSLSVAGDWMRRQAVTKRFNRIVLLRNIANQGLAATRNIGFDAAETDFVVPLDADNRLLPEFCSRTLRALRGTRAAFAYTKIQCFGDHHHVIGTDAFSQMLFSQANYVDAMALIAKWAWAGIGGYTHIQHGWEDYDFWCCCIEHGFWGIHVPEILAEYRFHEDSMLRTATDVQHNKREVVRQLEARHDWMSIVDRG